MVIGSQEVKTGQFADDLWSISPHSQQNVNEILRELDKFSSFSGLVINPQKTAILRIGPHKDDSDAKFYTLKRLFWSPGLIRILGIDITPDRNSLIECNYEQLLKKVEAILDRWVNRQLMLIGKITVINTLVNSLFTYKFLCIITPPSSFFVKYKAIITKFLWNGQPLKIAYKKLIQDHSKLGLKLIDLQMKNLALKASWPIRWSQRSLPEIDWFYENLSINDPRIWECNLSKTDIKPNLETLNVSLDILLAWAQVHFVPKIENYDSILMSMVWGNSLIRRKNQPILAKRFTHSGIDRILHLINNEGSNFLSFAEFTQQYGHNFDCLDYLSIIASIPESWKKLIRSSKLDHEIDQDRDIEKRLNLAINTGSSVSSKIYWELIATFYQYTPVSNVIWNRELSLNLTEEDLSDIFVSFLSDIKPTKLRYLQYQIISHALTTNVVHSKWNDSVTPLCSFCSTFPETVTHMFINCEYSAPLWMALNKMINYYFNLQIDLDPSTILLNNYTGKNKQMINMLLITFKHYIYSTKCQAKNKPIFTQYMLKLSYWFRIDKYIAYNSQNKKYINKFHSKWHNIF